MKMILIDGWISVSTQWNDVMQMRILIKILTYYSIGINRFYFDASLKLAMFKELHIELEVMAIILIWRKKFYKDPTTSSRQIAADLHVSQWKIWSFPKNLQFLETFGDGLDITTNLMTNPYTVLLIPET
ncbi:hypothetical protein NQ318_005030 [Aromia moschata]|uniref:Uncharacterized protein n=1 Tax=Aromia moschata TaxID=1265417 RepID=A0AAV8Y9S5_9CUCU|nr:hypothetical protein NQ318_005030 [Aromia moschata]